jgi:hypothetical protein
MLMKEKATRGDAGGRSCVAAARDLPMTVGASSIFLIVASGTAEPAGRREYATPGIPSIHRNGVEEVPESATFASLVRQAGALPQGLGSGVADVDDFGDLDPELAAMLQSPIEIDEPPPPPPSPQPLPPPSPPPLLQVVPTPAEPAAAVRNRRRQRGAQAAAEQHSQATQTARPGGQWGKVSEVQLDSITRDAAGETLLTMEQFEELLVGVRIDTDMAPGYMTSDPNGPYLMTKQKVRELFFKADTNKDGFVSLSESMAQGVRFMLTENTPDGKVTTMPELPGGGKWAEVGEVTIVKPQGSVQPSASEGEWKHIHVAEAKAEGGNLKRIFEAEGGDLNLQENGIYVAPGAKVIYDQQTHDLMARKGSRKVIEDNINVAPGGRVVYDKQTLESMTRGKSGQAHVPQPAKQPRPSPASTPSIPASAASAAAAAAASAAAAPFSTAVHHHSPKTVTRQGLEPRKLCKHWVHLQECAENADGMRKVCANECRGAGQGLQPLSLFSVASLFALPDGGQCTVEDLKAACALVDVEASTDESWHVARAGTLYTLVAKHDKTATASKLLGLCGSLDKVLAAQHGEVVASDVEKAQAEFEAKRYKNAEEIMNEIENDPDDSDSAQKLKANWQKHKLQDKTDSPSPRPPPTAKRVHSHTPGYWERWANQPWYDSNRLIPAEDLRKVVELLMRPYPEFLGSVRIGIRRLVVRPFSKHLLRLMSRHNAIELIDFFYFLSPFGFAFLMGFLIYRLLGIRPPRRGTQARMAVARRGSEPPKNLILPG